MARVTVVQNVHDTSAARRQSIFVRRLVTSAPVCSTGLAASVSTGCALFTSEYTVRADGISVAPTADAGTFAVRVFGFGSDGCATLKHVERSSRQGTLFRRLIGEGSGGECPQMSYTLPHNEQVVSPAGRTMVYAVQQPDGTLLVRALVVPSRTAASFDTKVAIAKLSLLPRKYSVLPRKYSVLPRKYSVLPRSYSLLPRKYSVLPRKYSVLPRKYSLLQVSTPYSLLPTPDSTPP